MADKDPTPTTELVRNFSSSQQRLDRAHDERERTKEQRDKDMQRLGLRLAPQDMEEGEKIGVWASDGYSERCYVVLLKRGKYHVSVRGARDVTK